MKYVESPSGARRFPLEVIPTLNRAIVFSTYIGGDTISFAVKHDKKTPGLQFQMCNDGNVLELKQLKVQMFRNLDTSDFCKTFLNLESAKDQRRDVRCKFNGVRPIYEKNLIAFSQEKYDFHVSSKSKPPINYMTVTGFKLQDSDNDLLFYMVQRKCFNDITKTHILRSAGLQIATNYGMECLNKYISNNVNRLRKVENDDSIPTFLSDCNLVKIEDEI